MARWATIRIVFEKGYMDISDNHIKYYDNRNRLIWSSGGDYLFHIPKETVDRIRSENVCYIFDRGRVIRTELRGE